ncbi:SPFH domain-containing protein [Thermobifida cellulosilytica]|uniref:Membrane protein n=1 Tax=Thermobifida cellulosilytica TB100 TaxID=665004 RepID=A0A147KIZ3_THECS|nr:SPFH domain-containing protein [Thermobifida cellulosilytica]KUP97256.1 membrane protein [Thermobifida cellulosilytica TB100]
MNQEAVSAVEMPEPRVRERVTDGLPGLPMVLLALAVLLAGAAAAGLGLYTGAGTGMDAGAVALTVAGLLLVLLGLLLACGLTIVAPNEARVVQFFGRYTGTVRTDGLRWVNPLSTRKPVSTRIRNHETAVMKVNDADGSPIEIAAVVVWQVRDTARAVFEVDDFVRFVGTQTEAAVRHIANNYPYDNHDGTDRLSLRDNADEITEKLSAEIAERVESAGVRIIESRLTHLAYAPEIAQAMLQRQQAGAIIAARQRIVEGAVGMVDLALNRLAEQDVVDLDEERKAAMVSNLLVVLCADRATQPVVNTGTLYS